MKSKRNLHTVLAIFLFSAVLFLPVFSTHAAGLVSCGDNSAVTGAPANVSNPCKLGDFFVLLARVTNFMIGFSGIYAILRIIIASIKLVTAAGNSETIAGGRSDLTNAMIGMIIVLLAYVIANTIFAIFAPKVGVSGQNGFLYNPFK